ncbi:MAG: glycosyltransferase family 39 protein [Nitrospiraceae bacterium]|nr:glycosyltransferase family 39 protein [Nitrospiraceae bacterium]
MGKYALPVIAIALFIAFFELSSFTLFDVDEAVFAQASKEMVQNRDWITPTYNGAKRFDKPIMIYWLMAGSYKMFGINEFAARFPSAVAACLLALAVFFFEGMSKEKAHFSGPFIRREKRAFYAALALMLSLFFLAYSHAAVTDMTLTLFITLSLLCFYVYSSKGGKGYIYGFYLFAALAFLTKGLIGIIFPAGIAFIYLFLTEGVAAALKKIWSTPGILLFLAVSSPWYIACYVANGNEFIRKFFIKQHFDRYLHVISGHTGPVYYYIPVLALGLFPWIAFLPQGVKNAFRERKDSPGFLALIWLSFVVVFFSFAKTKLPDYVLPGVPAAALLISSGISTASGRSGRLSNWFIALVSLALAAGFFIAKGYLHKAGIEAGWAYWLSGIMFLMALVSGYCAAGGKNRNGILALLMIGFLSVISLKAVPAASRYLQGGLYNFSIYAKKNLRPGGVLIGYKINNPSVVFYSGHRVDGIDGARELAAAVSGSRQAIIITRGRDSADVLALNGPSERVRLLQASGNYRLFEKD